MIRVCEKIKYLGIIASNRHLKSKDHSKNLMRLEKHMGILFKLQHIVARKQFYVKPELKYGFLIYGGGTMKNLDAV